MQVENISSIYTTELYISGESTPIFLQWNSWSKKHGGFLTNYDAIWRLTSFLWQRLKVVTASQAQYWARGCFHSSLNFLKDIFYFCSKFSHLSMRMIFMDYIWTFAFYWKMYKLFKISLALERNEELIKPWKCSQLRYFRSDSRQGIGTKYSIWRFVRNRYLKVLAFLSFKFNIFMFSLIWHQICKLDNWIYSTGVHWIFSLSYNLDVDSRNCLLARILFYR